MSYSHLKCHPVVIYDTKVGQTRTRTKVESERQRACVAADVTGAWSAVVENGASQHRLGDVQSDGKAAVGQSSR